MLRLGGISMVEISASVLGLKEKNAIKQLYDLEVSGINYFHIDVMDGEFVKIIL